MKETHEGQTTATRQRLPAGRALDDVPKALYVLAHVMFLAVGIWLWARAAQHALPYSGALVLYVISQVGFLAYFTNVINDEDGGAHRADGRRGDSAPHRPPRHLASCSEGSTGARDPVRGRQGEGVAPPRSRNGRSSNDSGQRG